MAKLNFYIRDKSVDDESTIRMSFHYDGNRLRMPTDCKVPIEYWNEKTQRVRELLEFPDATEINDKLDKLEEIILSLYKKYRDLGFYPYPREFRKEFLLLEGNPLKNRREKTFWDFFDEFVSYKENELSDVRDYNNSLRKHLTNIEKKIGRPLNFEILANSESNFDQYWNQYLLFEALNSEGNPGLTTNTAGKQNKNLKVFLNWCFERNVISRFSLKRFPTVQEDVDKVYVTEEELERINTIELESEEEQVIRDLFIIGCETGLRFSDFIRIDAKDIRNKQIHFRPKKTRKQGNNKIIIPVSERLESVFSKYTDNLPTFNGKRVTQFNAVLREICKKAGLTEEIVRYRFIAGKELKEVKFKYQEISSHTCRRTFCTLKFLKGMPAQAIMKFSGHKTERNFLKYLKLDAELTANKYGEFF